MLEKLNKVKEALDTCNQWDNGMAGRGQEFDEYAIDEAKETINTIIEELSERGRLEKKVAVAMTYARHIGSPYYDTSSKEKQKQIIEDYSQRKTRLKEARAAIATIIGEK